MCAGCAGVVFKLCGRVRGGADARGVADVGGLQDISRSLGLENLRTGRSQILWGTSLREWAVLRFSPLSENGRVQNSRLETTLSRKGNDISGHVLAFPAISLARQPISVDPRASRIRAPENFLFGCKFVPGGFARSGRKRGWRARSANRRRVMTPSPPSLSILSLPLLACSFPTQLLKYLFIYPSSHTHCPAPPPHPLNRPAHLDPFHSQRCLPRCRRHGHHRLPHRGGVPD